MKKLIITTLSLISLFSTAAFAGPLDSFVGSYTLQDGTDGTNSSSDLICPTPLILRLSIGALDSNMPQLPVLEVASTEENNVRYNGTLSSDGTTFNYKQVTKTDCAFFGLFCDTSTLEGSLSWDGTNLVLIHSESTSVDGVQSSGTCSYTK